MDPVTSLSLSIGGNLPRDITDLAKSSGVLNGSAKYFPTELHDLIKDFLLFDDKERFWDHYNSINSEYLSFKRALVRDWHNRANELGALSDA